MNVTHQDLSEPYVALVIRTYNRTAVIDRAIGSALDQTYEHIEIIVVDDGSTDDTESVGGAFDDDRLRYARQENAGANAARSHGVRLASGTYVSFLDSDGDLHPEHVKRVVETIEAVSRHDPPRWGNHYTYYPDATA